MLKDTVIHAILKTRKATIMFIELLYWSNPAPRCVSEDKKTCFRVGLGFFSLLSICGHVLVTVTLQYPLGLMEFKHLTKLCERWKIKIIRIHAYHSQSQGKREGYHATWKRKLYFDIKRWAEMQCNPASPVKCAQGLGRIVARIHICEHGLPFHSAQWTHPLMSAAFSEVHFKAMERFKSL